MSIQPDPLFDTRTSTPYAGTTGHAGPGPSADRAVREAHDGTAADRQARILALLEQAGPIGMTADELTARGVAPHRSAVSAHTSSMHKDGRIECLAQRRSGSGIYVMPEHVNGRATRDFAGRTAPVITADADVTEALAELERLRAARLTLTPHEQALLAKIRSFTDKTQQNILLKRDTVRVLLSIIDRATGGQ